MAMRGGMGRMIGNEKQSKPSRPIRVLLSNLKEFTTGLGRPIIIFFILSLLYALTLVFSPLLLSRGIEAFSDINQGTVFLFNHDVSIPVAIFILLGIFYGLNVLGFFLDSFATRTFSTITGTFVDKIRIKLYDKLIHSSMDYLKNQQSGNITSRITSDTDQVTSGIQTFTRIASQFVLLLTTLIILILGTTWQIILICLCSVPIALLISFILSKLGRRIILKIRRAFGIVSGRMAESFSGVIVAKSFNREESLSKQMSILNQQHYKMSQKFGIMMFVTMPMINFIGRVTMAVILYVGGVIDLSVAEIFLAISLSGRFLRPITFLAMAFPELQNAMGSLDRILDVMEAAPVLPDSPSAEELNNKYSVKFDDVWFSYLPNEEIIKGISLEVKEGEILALIGKTGAGKTTLASNLLPRFYDIQRGSIVIGDQNIKNVKQASLHDAIGLIPQDPYLFSESVMDNLRYGKADATNDEIYEICRLLGADLFIEALPDGYNTKLTEGGKKLSAGQRQMITIARTMLADPKILILDEATSRLDAYSESLVQRAQAQLFEGRTTFVIAHRLSTIHHSDKIVVLDNGKIVEQGNHDELMEKAGKYAELYHTYYSFQGFEEIDLQVSE